MYRSIIPICCFLLSCFASHSQQKDNDYKLKWSKTDTLIKKGLNKSALNEINIIYSLAKKDNNDVQIIKTLLYKTSLIQNIEEDAQEKSIGTLEEEINQSTGPEKSILQSITAQLYWNYFQQNRYKIYQRTNTINFDKKDIATWTVDDFHKKISSLYLYSLKDEALLQQTNLEPFDAIIDKGNTRILRPTLYDLLAHRALDYFKNNESDITQPSYSFEIKDNVAFDPANEFIKYNFATKDSTSIHHKALLIFQSLLKFHLKDKQPDALIDEDLERIEFVNEYGVMDNKDSLYINSLQNVAVSYSNNPLSAQASFLVAEKMYNDAQQNNNAATISKYSVLQAKILLDAIAKRFPQSEGGINARNLINQIIHPTVSLATEKVNVPGLPFRTLVTYKNFNAIYFRIIPLTPQLKAYISENANAENVFSKLTSQKNIRAWKQNLPVINDYLSHATEVKIDSLPVGEYALIGSADKGFSLDANPLAVQYIYVSNISFINSGSQYFLLNRTTGQPLQSAKIQVWKQQYDYTIQKNKLEKKELFISDKNGYFKLSNDKNNNENNYVRLEINYKDDHLFMDDAAYIYTYNNDEDDNLSDQKGYDKTNSKIFLFTDRSIYRPGQLVYFKGIGVTKNWKTKKPELLNIKDSITVYLKDANSQSADSARFVLNEFGSFNGKFHLPENKLDGEFSIDIAEYENSSATFSVEEYKRPKFYTELEKNKKDYRVGDTVMIKGFGKAYAGNNIDGALVKYSITRRAIFIYTWMFTKSFPRSSPMVIANGETITDANGNFNVAFKAIPDLTLDKNTDPVFNYEVHADITDINGETRSADITVPIGYKSLNLQINLSQNQIDIDSLKNISVTSKNLSSEPVNVKAELKIYKLQSPERLIRERFWEHPDTFVLTKTEYINYFPHDEYKDETNKETWTKEQLIYNTMDSTNNDSKFKIQNLKLQPGWYVIEATAKDSYGNIVTDKKYIQLFDKAASGIIGPAYLWNYSATSNVEPGNISHILTGTSEKNIFMIQQIVKQDNGNAQTKSDPTNFSFYILNNIKGFNFPITENDRGGFGVIQFFVRDNRFYMADNTINVSWSNKNLNISFDTYRDKTLPGSAEKWKVKITGSKSEKIAAEMVASMYDASLDQFKQHSWNTFDIWPIYSGYNQWNSNQNFSSVYSTEKYWSEKYLEQKEKTYDVLNYLNSTNYTGVRIRGVASFTPSTALSGRVAGVQIDKANPQEVVVVGYSNAKAKTNLIADSTRIQNQNINPANNPSQIQIRKNFNETAFFYPELKTDIDGNVEFSFTMPDALTQWKLMTFAYDKELASGYSEKTVVTQKDLMVQPDAPRFLREGDKMEFTAKIVNLTDKDIRGNADLHLQNASAMINVDKEFKNNIAAVIFTAKANQSAIVKFTIDVPVNFNDAVVYTIIANSANASDGEEAAIPVVANRMLVTESIPLSIRGDGSKNYKFGKLTNSKSSSTLNSYNLTVEYTTNPAWYAIQSLPYLMEYPYECAEQTFNRYYANAVATKIVNASPKIKEIFTRWATADTSALMSNLQKNEELKSLLLEETPWVVQAKNEEQQKKNIALLFDAVNMNLQLQSALDKLNDMQSSNGGFVWFKGGTDDRYITQYIITGIGHLKNLNALPQFEQTDIKNILDKAISYADLDIKKDYDNLIKYKVKLSDNHLSNIAVQYLYMRSFFPEYVITDQSKTACTYYREQAKKYWLSQNKYVQAMIALSLYRTNDKSTAISILKSLKENSINNDELGMYWKEWNNQGYWWYQAPIESQSLMIEAFDEIAKDKNTVDDLKTWLLKNKQINNWGTTKATADACYALLLNGNNWLSQEKNVTIKLGDFVINNSTQKQEAGTGYFKTKIDGDKITPEMGNINVTVSSSTNPSNNEINNQSPSWGAVYWQYFEDLDKVTFSETPLKLSKKLFIEKNTNNGPALIEVNNNDSLHIGDKIKVRIELRVDHDMEYIHMKDMRASCMEPTNVLSEYKYQDGLGYYETTKDASTNFFFDHLNKGTFVFEYPMFVTHRGDFSNGISTIQCMYAPEITAHSEGVRVSVK